MAGSSLTSHARTEPPVQPQVVAKPEVTHGESVAGSGTGCATTSTHARTHGGGLQVVPQVVGQPLNLEPVTHGGKG